MGTTMVGTIRSNSRGLPKEITGNSANLYQSRFYSKEHTGEMLVNYQCKHRKNVCVLSTMHASPDVEPGEKRKPSVIHYYNKNKVGVDVVDEMLRLYTTKSKTRRWPVAVWANVLDMALLNAWVVYKKATKSTVSRRQFLIQLIEDLRAAFVRQNKPPQLELELLSPPKKRKRCKGRACKNMTTTTCRKCTQPVCGSCSKVTDKVVISTCNDCQ